MPVLTSTASTVQPDYVALAMILALLLAVAVAAIRKYIHLKRAPQHVAPVPAPKAEIPAAPGTAGSLKLHNVEPKTAAMVMAIVADKLGKPLNELRFISIKEVE